MTIVEMRELLGLGSGVSDAAVVDAYLAHLGITGSGASGQLAPDPFALALDALFVAPGSVPAVYTPAATGVPGSVRIVRTQDTREIGFGQSAVLADINLIQIRRVDVHYPLASDRIEIGGETFAIQTGPRIDVEGLTWTCGIEPAP